MCNTRFSKAIACTSGALFLERKRGEWWHGQMSASPFSYRLKIATTNVASKFYSNVRVRRTIGGLSTEFAVLYVDALPQRPRNLDHF